ncbi:MAG TPA: type III pantothenate kinase [Chthonomonadales bacterium]|nr:type III pantothenate kinase [Chthonomonadales bacterium]
MLMTVDVGNTHITVGAYRGDRLLADWRVRTDRERTTDEHGLLFTHLLQARGLEAGAVDGFAMACVVPTMTQTVAKVGPRYFAVAPLVVSAKTNLGLRVHYRPPSDVGADRLVNAVATRSRYGVPAIVVDFGTATTLDAIDEHGDYLGGAIAPGIGISSDALFGQASRLYRVELNVPENAIGHTTVEAMQAGILFGFAGQVDALVRRMRQEMSGTVRVVATGGLARTIAPLSETIEVVDPLLTLEGLRLLWDRAQLPAEGAAGDVPQVARPARGSA